MKTHLARQSESRQAGNASMSPSVQKAEQAHVVDARPEALMQRKLQHDANASAQTGQLLAMSVEMNSGARSLQLQAQAEQSKSGNLPNAAMPAQRKIQVIDAQDVVQRFAVEEPLQAKSDTVQRAEDEELLQGKFQTAQRMEEDEALQGKFETALRVEEDEFVQAKSTGQGATQLAEKTNNTGLPNQLKTGIESLSGMSMDHVKVHYNSGRPAQLNAHAYAQGSEIHLASGQERHLPHEAWHVVQQAQGRVKPTMQMKHGVDVNDDVALEAEADLMGAQANGVGQQMQQHKERSFTERSNFNSQTASPRVHAGSLNLNQIEQPSLANNNVRQPKSSGTIKVIQRLTEETQRLLDVILNKSLKTSLPECGTGCSSNAGGRAFTDRSGNGVIAYRLHTAICISI